MAMFRKANIYNSNVWKKLIFGIPMFGKKKIQNSNVWKKGKFTIGMFGKGLNLE